MLWDSGFRVKVANVFCTTSLAMLILLKLRKEYDCSTLDNIPRRNRSCLECHVFGLRSVEVAAMLTGTYFLKW